MSPRDAFEDEMRLFDRTDDAVVERALRGEECPDPALDSVARACEELRESVSDVPDEVARRHVALASYGACTPTLAGVARSAEGSSVSPNLWGVDEDKDRQDNSSRALVSAFATRSHQL